MASSTAPFNGSLAFDELRRILLIRLSSLGDILLMTPLLNLLHAACPQAQIDVLIKAEYRDLLRVHPGITRLLTFDSRQPLLRTLRGLRVDRYDLALDLHCTPRSQVLLRGLRARRKLTYNKRVVRRALLVRLGWNTLQRMTPVPELYTAPLQRLGLTGRLGAPTMHLDPESMETMQTHIARSLPDAPDLPLLAVAPGARWPTKRWPVERFAAAAQELAREKQAVVVILGGPDEAQLAHELCGKLDVPVINGAGTLPLMGQRRLVEPLPVVNQQRLRPHAHGNRAASSRGGHLRTHRAGVRILPVSGPRRGRQRALALPPVQHQGLAALSAGASRLHAGHLQCPRAGCCQRPCGIATAYDQTTFRHRTPISPRRRRSALPSVSPGFTLRRRLRLLQRRRAPLRPVQPFAASGP